jgi:hypothetical protein
MAIPFTLPSRSWADTLSDVLFKLVLMGLAFAATSLLLRDALAIGAHVPLDPSEGWNAYLAKAAMSGGPLYPQDGLMINNYPPLSFYIVGALSRITGDPIVAGRLVSLISFFALCGSIIAILREMGSDVLSTLFASLFLAVSLLAASGYVAMNDPQLLGHALQLAGLSLLLPSRRDAVAAALLMAAGLFVKHNLLALPLAASLWLMLQDRKDAMRFVLSMVSFCLAGLVAARLFLGVDLIGALAVPRHLATANAVAGFGQFLRWSGAALIVTAGMIFDWHSAALRLAILYAGFALGLGGVFAFSDGMDMNIFFDAAIALSLGAGLALVHLPKRWAGPLALFVAAPVALYLAQTHRQMNFAYSEAFAREAPLDIGFIEVHRGPALCQNLTLCFWAEKGEPVDFFNLSQAYLTGARSDAELAHRFDRQYFGSIVVNSLTALNPHLKDAMLARYRVVHEDDNGVFLERIISRNTPP